MRSVSHRHTRYPDAFIIRIAPCVSLVEIIMRGFWDLATVGRFDRALRTEWVSMAARGIAPGRYRLLLDLTDFDVQTRETLAILQAMARDHAIGGQRAALVMASSMVRIQMRRIVPDWDQFDTRDAALAHLSDESGATSDP